jgi:hypothetical protein
LKRNLFELFALCRVVPGVDIVAFIACGWSRVPIGRFLVASLLVSALYLPLMFYLVVVFGAALDDHVGLWTWPFLASVIVAVGFVRHRVFTLTDAARTVGDKDSPDLAKHPALRARPIRPKSPSAWRIGMMKLQALPSAAKWIKLR